jgi:hypothetical protein
MKYRKNLKAFAFENEYGWMNAMKGSKWKRLVKKFNSQYETVLEDPTVKSLASTLKSELSQQPSYTKPVTLEGIQYEMRGNQSLLWKFIKGDTDDVFAAADIDVEGETVWAVEDRSNGSEQYTLSSYKQTGPEWTYKKNVGPFVAVKGNRCYAIEVENFLWLCRLISVDSKTGKDRQVELEMKDPGWNLQLAKAANGCLFVVANNAGSQKLWTVSHRDVKELTGEGEAFVVIGYTSKSSDNPSYLQRNKGSSVYTPVNWRGNLPLQSQTPEWIEPSLGLACTRTLGRRSLWDTKTGKKVLSLVANIDHDSLGAWKGKTSSITLQEPGSYRQELSAYLTNQTLCGYASHTYKTVKSADGSTVPYILVSNCKPKYLLCLVYGAYGVPTRLGVDRWKPLLDRGWGLCIALVRGGGDHTDAWAESGRRAEKMKSVEDFEACILAARKEFTLGASHTAVYGRSAGGYTVGAALSRNASGTLFQGVYTEVPYVDVLNTTANPRLPLTKLEYEEFGNPLRLQDAQTLITLSPVDSLPSTGAPNIFVLSRTALNDKEVFAYESVKWIHRLQELDESAASSEPKLLRIEDEGGHFSTEARGKDERSNDLSILHFWATHSKKSHEGIYTMVATRRNNAARKRRNNVSMRKRRNNVSMRKRRNNAVGGKRRRSTTRRGH